jgi:hypothetical protein
MYLEEILVQHWRGITHQHLRLAPGLNIIHGPNECGKSSLRQAVRAAFLQNPGSKTREALAARSWGGQSLPPSVRVDFHLDGDRWSLEKTFFSSKGSRLSRNGVLLAGDGDVHKKLETLLSSTVWPGSLWGEQGDTSIPEVPRALRGKLVAEEVVSPGLLWLEDRIKELEGEYWTATGRPKKSLQDARGRVAQADEAAEDAVHALEDTNAISESVRDLHEDLQQIRDEESELAERLGDMRQKVGVWDRYRAARAQWDTRVKDVLHQVQWLERWERSADQVVVKWKALQDYRVRVAALDAQKLEEPSREPVEKARARCEYAVKLQQQRVHEQLVKLKPPTAKQLAALRQLENELTRCEAALESVSMKLSLTALAAITPAVQIDEQERSSLQLSTGETMRWEVHSQARLVLPGVAEFGLQSGASDVEDLLARRDKSRTELRRLLDELDCKTVEQAQSAADRARSLQAVVEGQPPTQSELDRLAQAAGDVSDLQSLPAETLREQARSMRGDLDEAEAQWSAARRAYDKYRAERDGLARANPGQALELHLQQLQGESESWPLEQGKPRVPEVAALTGEWVAELEAGAPVESLRGMLDQEKEKLEREKLEMRPPEGQEVTSEVIALAEQRLQNLAQQRERLVSQLNQHLGRLRERSDQFLTLARRREEHAALRDETNQAELQAAATQLLCQTFQEARANLQRDIVGPLQQRVADRLALVTRGRYRGLNLDERLCPTSVAPRGFESAALTDLSFGTQEQLLFLTRLCLAEMLSEKHGRQTLIFDDSLVHTDDSRLESARKLLSEVSEVCQIVVLTCHPEKYARMESARMLEFLASES